MAQPQERVGLKIQVNKDRDPNILDVLLPLMEGQKQEPSVMVYKQSDSGEDYKKEIVKDAA
jgi:hypothetical protein